jgi:hypothetical protein
MLGDSKPGIRDWGPEVWEGEGVKRKGARGGCRLEEGILTV